MRQPCGTVQRGRLRLLHLAAERLGRRMASNARCYLTVPSQAQGVLREQKHLFGLHQADRREVPQHGGEEAPQLARGRCRRGCHFCRASSGFGAHVLSRALLGCSPPAQVPPLRWLQPDRTAGGVHRSAEPIRRNEAVVSAHP